jgi:hypothetical protein
MLEQETPDMTLTLEVPAQVEDRPRVAAQRRGVDVSEYVRHALNVALLAEELPTDGPALLQFWQEAGVIGMRPDIADSQEHAAEIRRAASQRESPST